MSRIDLPLHIDYGNVSVLFMLITCILTATVQHSPLDSGSSGPRFSGPWVPRVQCLVILGGIYDLYTLDSACTLSVCNYNCSTPRQLRM